MSEQTKRVNTTWKESELNELDKFCEENNFNRSEVLRLAFKYFKSNYIQMFEEKKHDSNNHQLEKLVQEIQLLRSMIESMETRDNRQFNDVNNDLNRLPDIKLSNIKDIHERIYNALDQGPMSTPMLASKLDVEESTLILIISKMKGIKLNHDYDWELTI